MAVIIWNFNLRLPKDTFNLSFTSKVMIFDSCLLGDVYLYATSLCDKVCLLLVAGQWLSTGTHVCWFLSSIKLITAEINPHNPNPLNNLKYVHWCCSIQVFILYIIIFFIHWFLDAYRLCHNNNSYFM